MSKTIIVVPCFNEAKRLPVQTIQEFARKTEEVRLLLVDDGSTDGTLDLLHKLVRDSPQVIEIHSLPRNMGKGEAVRRGLLVALQTDAAYVGFWDADLATPLGAIAELQNVMDDRAEIEMVFGARVKLLGRTIERHAVRHYLGRVFATAVSLMLRIPVYDTQCGAKLFRVTNDLKVLLAEPFVSRWIFDVEIIARLIRLRRGMDRSAPETVIYEYPLTEWRDVSGSKLSSWAFLRAAVDLMRIRFAS